MGVLKMSYKPLHNLVLIRAEMTEETTAGGIILPDQSKERPGEGVVVRCGPGIYSTKTGVLIPMSVEPGDRVMFSKNSGREIKAGDENLVLLGEGSIWAIIEEEE